MISRRRDGEPIIDIEGDGEKKRDIQRQTGQARSG